MGKGPSATSLLPIPKPRGRGRPPKQKNLTISQRRFVEILMADPNFDVKEACRKAGYASPHVMAYKLLRLRQIQAYLADKMREREKKSNVSNERILCEVDTMALRDPVDLCDKQTGLIITDDLRKIPEGIRRCIDGIEVKQKIDKLGRPVGQTIRLKLVPKATALELAMKHRGLLAPIKVDVKQGLDWDQLIDDGTEDEDLVEKRLAHNPSLADKKWMDPPQPEKDEDPDEEDDEDDPEDDGDSEDDEDEDE